MATLTNLEQVAAGSGYPSTLFGFTPNERAYWFEPGLPWLPTDWGQQAPPTTFGPGLWCFAAFGAQSMAPRFPKGCVVNIAPVRHKADLVIGRVYLYLYADQNGEQCAEAGRLAVVRGNYVEVTGDNDAPNAPRRLWLLREVAGQETWDVREVTHYVSYPGEAESV